MTTPYKDWLNYIMGVKRLDREKLATRAGVEVGYVDSLLSGQIAEPPVDKVHQIGRALNITDQNMDKVLDSLDIHVDLGKFKNACGNPCCFWNAPID